MWGDTLAPLLIIVTNMQFLAIYFLGKKRYLICCQSLHTREKQIGHFEIIELDSLENISKKPAGWRNTGSCSAIMADAVYSHYAGLTYFSLKNPNKPKKT